MPKNDLKLFKESWEEHGAVLCDECNSEVDLSDAGNWAEAKELWNDHVEGVHAE